MKCHEWWSPCLPHNHWRVVNILGFAPRNCWELVRMWFLILIKLQNPGCRAGKAHLEMTKQDFGVQSKVPYLHRSLGCRRRPQLDLISSLKTSTEGLHHTWVRNFFPVKATTVTTEQDSALICTGNIQDSVSWTCTNLLANSGVYVFGFLLSHINEMNTTDRLQVNLARKTEFSLDQISASTIVISVFALLHRTLLDNPPLAALH